MLLADDHAGLAARGRVGEREQLSPDGTTFAPTWQSATSAPSLLERGEAAEPAPRDVLEEDALDRLLARRSARI